MTIPLGYAQCNLAFIGAGLPFGAQVTFGVVTPGGSNPLGVATTVGSLVNTNIMPRLSSSVQLTNVHCKFGPDATGAFADYAIVATGGRTSAESGPAMSALAQKLSAFGGRANRGRMYWPGVAEADVNNDGTLIGSEVTAWTTALNGLLSGLTTAGVPMVVLHKSPLATPVTVTSLVIQIRCGTQRRRQRRT